MERPATIGIMRLGIFALLVGVSVLSVPTGVRGEPIVYSLADDWSDSDNPNGPWSYTGDDGVLLSTHFADWDPTSGCCFPSPQPAWAAARWPNPGHVPMWFKAAATGPLDVPIGRVGMHGSAGGTTKYVGVVWTSPLGGPVDVSGGVWNAARGFLSHKKKLGLEITIKPHGADHRHRVVE